MNFRDLTRLDAALRRGLIVSCQPVDDGPLDDDDVVRRLAQAAIAGGAAGVRIEGARRLAHVRNELKAPIIGIVKRDLSDSLVRITPFLSDVDALANAGADVIAVDATDRERPVSVPELLAAIRRTGALAMADCATEAEARTAHALGFDIVGTTLSGYTGGTVPEVPDYALLATLAKSLPRVMAEGRFNTPAQVAEAMSLGAWAVTVGTAITRTEAVVGWFRDAAAAAP